MIARDVTAVQRSQLLAERLHELTTALSQEITPERAIDVLLDKAVAGLEAAAGAVGMLDALGRDDRARGKLRLQRARPRGLAARSHSTPTCR